MTLLTVTDLHRSAALLEALSEAVVQRKPDIVALVGDFQHAFDDNEGRVTVEECAGTLSKLLCAEILFVRGNHEDEAWWVFADAWNKSGRLIACPARRGLCPRAADDCRFSVPHG